MILSTCCLTDFEIASIVIGVFTAIGTVGATMAAVWSTISKSINQLSIKNYERRLNLEDPKDTSDIVVRNSSLHDITINRIVFTYKEREYSIKNVDYANKRVKLPIVLKPLESFHIKNLIDEILIAIVPEIDYMYIKDATRPSSVADFYKKYFDKKHIKFTIIDSEQHKHRFFSKYSVTSYLKDYVIWGLLSPWKIERVQRYVESKKNPCIITGTWQKDFELYLPNSDTDIYSLEDYIKDLSCACSDEYITNVYGIGRVYVIGFVFEKGIRIYEIDDDDNWDFVLSRINDLCTNESVNSITKLTLDYLTWDIDDNKEDKKCKHHKRKLTFEELIETHNTLCDDDNDKL